MHAGPDANQVVVPSDEKDNMVAREHQLLALVILAGCGGQSLGQHADTDEGSHADTGVVDVGQVFDAGSSQEGAPDVSYFPDLVDATNLDSGSDVDWTAGLSPVEAEYFRFLLDAAQIRAKRLVDCFHESGPAVAAEAEPEQVLQRMYARASLSLGMREFDTEQAQACIAAMLSASCQEFAVQNLFNLSVGDSIGARGVCDLALVGKVPAGGVCFDDGDCENPDKLICDHGDRSGNCRFRCTPRTALGQPCSGATCSDGNLCRPVDGGSYCAAPAELDEPCLFDEHCRVGLYCRRSTNGDVAGLCRPLAPGGSCQGTWQCPPHYPCDLPAAGGPGICSVGRSAGEACQVEPGKGSIGRTSNCASTLSCDALDVATAPTCAEGRVPPPVPPASGADAGVKRVGDECSGFDTCELLSDCVDGACQRCTD